MHKRECAGNDLAVGQAVSFVYEEALKGGNAKHVKEEEGGEPVIEEDEGERELGKVKSYNEEKGFAFIVSGRSLLLNGKNIELTFYCSRPGALVVMIFSRTKRNSVVLSLGLGSLSPLSWSLQRKETQPRSMLTSASP